LFRNGENNANQPGASINFNAGWPSQNGTPTPHQILASGTKLDL